MENISHKDESAHPLNISSGSQPSQMIFSKKKSSTSLQISPNSMTVKSRNANSYAICNTTFTEGIHAWEIICSLKCIGMQIGVVSPLNNPNEYSEQSQSDKKIKEENMFQQFKQKFIGATFRTTTPRVITVVLDLRNNIVNFWIDGKPLAEMKKSIPQGKIWSPAVSFLDADLEATINPFSYYSVDTPQLGFTQFQSSLISINQNDNKNQTNLDFKQRQILKTANDLHDTSISGGIKTYPSILSEPLDNIQTAYLQAELSSYLFATSVVVSGTLEIPPSFGGQEGLIKGKIEVARPQFENMIRKHAGLKFNQKTLKNQQSDTPQTVLTSDLPKDGDSSSQQNITQDQIQKSIEIDIQNDDQQDFNEEKEEDQKENEEQIEWVTYEELLLGQKEAESNSSNENQEKPSVSLLLAVIPCKSYEESFRLYQKMSTANNGFVAVKDKLVIFTGYQIAKFLRYQANADILQKVFPQFENLPFLAQLCQKMHFKLHEVLDFSQLIKKFILEKEPSEIKAQQEDLKDFLQNIQVPKQPKSQQESENIFWDVQNGQIVTQGSNIKFMPIQNQTINLDILVNSPNDIINLELSHSEFKNLIEQIDASTIENGSVVTKFFRQSMLSKDEKIKIKCSIIEIILALRSLLRSSLHKFYTLEEKLLFAQAKVIQEGKLTVVNNLVGNQQNEDLLQSTDFFALNKVFQTLAILEEQVYQKLSSSEPFRKNYSHLLIFVSGKSRSHTALGRLQSLISFQKQDYQEIERMAELGLMTVFDNDEYQGLRYFEYQKVNLDDMNCFIDSNSGKIDYRTAIETQLKNACLPQSLPCCNVPLINSVLSMPALNHISFSAKQNIPTIDQIKQLKGTDFILSECKLTNTVNLWSFRSSIGIIRLQILDFFPQISIHHNYKKIRAQPLFTYYKEQEKTDKGNAIVYLKQKKEQTTQSIGLTSLKKILLNQKLFDDSSEEQVPDEKQEQVSEESQLSSEEEFEFETCLLESQSAFFNTEISSVVQFQQCLEDIENGLIRSKGQIQWKLSQKDLKLKIKSEQLQVQQPELKKIPVEEKQEKKADKKVEADPEMLEELQAMGFDKALSIWALVKTKNKDIGAAIEVILPKQAEKIYLSAKYTKFDWACTDCSFLNPAGGNVCKICGAGAPAFAFDMVQPENEASTQQEVKIDEKSEQNDQQKQNDLIEELRKKKEEKLNKRKLKIEKKFEETVLFLNNYQAKSYIFSSIQKVIHESPLLIGGVFLNEPSKVVDVYLKKLRYRQNYLDTFIETVSKGQIYENKLTKEVFEKEDEAIKNLLKNNKTYVNSYFPKFGDFESNQPLLQAIVENKSEMKFLGFSQNKYFQVDDLAMVRLPLQQVDFVCQIGDDLSHFSPLFVLVCGKIKDEVKSYLIDIQFEENLIQIEQKSVEIQNLFGMTKNIVQIEYDSCSDKVVVITSDNSLIIFQNCVNFDDFNLYFEEIYSQDLKQDQKVKIQNGFIYDDSSNIILDLSQIQKEKDSNKKLPDLQIGNTLVDQEQNSDNLFLKDGKIDPLRINEGLINQFENLMKGQAIQGISNNDKEALKGEPIYKDKPLLKRHHWLVNEDVSSSDHIITFEKDTRIISVNLDLTFVTNKNYLQASKQQSLSDVFNQISQDDIELEIPDIVMLGKTMSKLPHEFDEIENIAKQELDQPAFILQKTQLSLIDPGSDSQKKVQSMQSSAQGQKMIELIVDKHTGAQFNSSNQVNTLVINNQQEFASNYARPEFYFKHLHGQNMVVQSFIVRSGVNSRTGAYPMGSGLIFLGNSYEDFEKSKPFFKFSNEEYQRWKQQRDERLGADYPLQPHEPVAAFEMDLKTSVTIDLDQKYECRIILLKPTGYRKKPINFKQNVNDLHMELEYFGAIGHSVSFDPLQKFIEKVQQRDNDSSGYNVSIQDSESKLLLHTLPEVNLHKLDILQSNQNSLNEALILSNSGLSGIASSSLRLQSDKLSKKPLSSILINLSRAMDNQWKLIKVSAIIRATMESQLPAELRQQLIEPEQFQKINKQLCNMLHDIDVTFELKRSIMTYLQNLMKRDETFRPLVIESLQLKEFINQNILVESAVHIQAACDFLRCFQSNSQFEKQLFEILKEIIFEQFSQSVPPKHAYEVILRLFNLLTGLNPNQSLQVCLNTLFNKICFQSLRQLQLPHTVYFRTRFYKGLIEQSQIPQLSFNTQPFDTYNFKLNEENEQSQLSEKQLGLENQKNEYLTSNIIQNNSSSKQDLKIFKNCEINLKQDHLIHTFNVKYDSAKKCRQIKIFFEEGSSSIFNLTVTVQIGFKTVLRRFISGPHLARYICYKKTSSNTKEVQNEAMKQDNFIKLNLSEVQSDWSITAKVTLIYSYTSQTLPSTVVKNNKPPQSVCAFYGLQNHDDHSEQTYQEMVKDYEKNNAKTKIYGKSCKFLVIEYPSVPGFYEQICNIKMIPSIQETQHKALKLTPITMPQTILSDNQQSLQQCLNELQLAQSEFQAALRESEPQKEDSTKKMHEKLNKIIQFQEKVKSLSSGKLKPANQSYEYLSQFCIDLIQLINSIVENHSIDALQFRQAIIDILPPSKQNLDDLAFELFKNFVVFDKGEIQSKALQFIKKQLWWFMTKEEEFQFLAKVLGQFLDKPRKTFSQKQVINALQSLNIASGDLFFFLAQSMGVNQDQQLDFKERTMDLSLKPFILLSSVFTISMSTLNHVDQNLITAAAHLGQDDIEKLQKMHNGLIESPDKKLKNTEKQIQDQSVSPQVQSAEEEQVSGEVDQVNEELKPLQIKRSYSGPTKGIPITKLQLGRTKKNKTLPLLISTNKLVQQYSVGKLDEDQQFLVVFDLTLWICKAPESQITLLEKKILLKQAIDNLNQLQKRITSLKPLKHIVQIAQNRLLDLTIVVLSLNDEALFNNFKVLLIEIAIPKFIQKLLDLILTLDRRLKINSDQKLRDNLQEAKQFIRSERSKHYDLLKLWSSQIQGILIWLVEQHKQEVSHETLLFSKHQLQTSPWVQILSEKSKSNPSLWIKCQKYLLQVYQTYRNTLTNIQKAQEKHRKSKKKVKNLLGLDPENDDLEITPLKITKSISLPIQNLQKIRTQSSGSSVQLIKSLMSLIFQFNEKKKENVLSEIWSLTLQSMHTVSIPKLIESRLIEQLLQAFLQSSKDIQHLTFPSILKICEHMIEDQTVQPQVAKLFIDLTFQMIKVMCTNPAMQTVSFALCQGWLDLLLIGSLARSTTTDEPNDALPKSVHIKMNPNDCCDLLNRTCLFLREYLNFGSFEGPTGANQLTVMKLTLVQDLVYLALDSKSIQSPKSAIQEFLTQVETTNIENLKQQTKEIFENLILWLVLNHRDTLAEIDYFSLGLNVSCSPATSKVNRIVIMLETFLKELTTSNTFGEEVIKMALGSLIKVIKSMHQSLKKYGNSGSLSAQSLIRLGAQTNDYFLKLVSSWLKSDVIANSFVFDLNGFEFLLDTIGQQAEKNISISQTPNQDSLIQIFQGESLNDSFDEASDLLDDVILHQINSLEEKVSKEQPKDKQQKQEKADDQNTKKEISEVLKEKLTIFNSQKTKLSNQQKGSDDTNKISLKSVEAPQLVLGELANKQLQLIEDNSLQPLSETVQKLDWSQNKKGYKNRLMVQNSIGEFRNEYFMIFKLPSVAILKEIQIGFTNYWTSETEIHSEPLSVVIAAGMNKEDMTIMCSLDLVKDDGFSSAQASVFGKNFQTFNDSYLCNSEQIEVIINEKIASLINFQARYIKISMRRSILSCLENSPMAPRQSKRHQFAINYISLQGYKINDDIYEVQESARLFVLQEQKRTALEVLSKLCSGNFSQVLKVIANQQKTIEKLKSQFMLLASLVTLKNNLIEPTFIALAKYNRDLGNWMIQQFLRLPSFERYSSLTLNLVMCEKVEIIPRLNMIQQFLIESINSGVLVSKLLPVIQNYTQAVRSYSTNYANQTIIDLAVDDKWLLKVIDAAEQFSNNQNELKVLRQFTILFLIPPKPFINTKASPLPFAIQILHDQDENQIDQKSTSEQSQRQRELLASILGVTNNQIAQHILEKRLRLNELTYDYQDQDLNQEQVLRIRHAVNFWLNLLQNSKILNLLQKGDLPFSLYRMLRGSQNQISQQPQLQKLGAGLVNDLVELIKILILNDSELKSNLANLLISDLDHLSLQRDLEFINKVYMPIIKAERCLPVCIGPKLISEAGSYQQKKNQDLNQILTTGSTLLDDKAAENVSAKGDEIENPFVNQSFLKTEQQEYLKKAIKHFLPQNSDYSAQEIWKQQWKKQLETQNQQENIEEFEDIWTKMVGKGPTIILCKANTIENEQLVFGAFWQGKVPEISKKDNNLEQNYQDIEEKPGDFCFVYSKDNYQHFKSPEGKPLARVSYLNQIEESCIQVGGSFMYVNNSQEDNFQSLFGEIDDVVEVQIPGFPQKSGNSILSKSNKIYDEIACEIAEIWTLESGNNNLEQERDQNDQINGQNNLQLDQKHPWINSQSAFGYFRSSPVYMVPALLKVNDILQLLLKRRGHIETYLNNQVWNMQNAEMRLKTLLDAYSIFLEDENRYHEKNCIIDINYDIDQVLKQTKEFEAVKKLMEHENTDQNLDTENIQLNSTNEIQDEKFASFYLPQMSFFTIFEEKGGVIKIIQLAIESLKGWRIESMALTWKTWLEDLEQFSKVQMFFQLFLRSQKSKDLLFKILAGQPDTDLQVDTNKKAEWESIYASAMQTNYKLLYSVFSYQKQRAKLAQQTIEIGLLTKILDRIAILSGEKPRILEIEKEIDNSPQKLANEDQQNQDLDDQLSQEKEKLGQLTRRQQLTMEKKKKKGVGYSNKQGQTFDVNAYLKTAKEKNDQLKTLVDIIYMFLDTKEYSFIKTVPDTLMQSALFPLLEQAFRNGSFLDMAKSAKVYSSYLRLTRTLASQQNLLQCLDKLDDKYKPAQKDSICVLLSRLNDLAQIFLGCLKQQKGTEKSESAERPKKLANEVTYTFKIVIKALEEHKQEFGQQEIIENAMSLPLPEQYRALLEGLRFDYMDMRDPKTAKEGSTNNAQFIHHYKALASQNESPPASKMIRLAQELADLSNALPCEHTNSIFVRVDKSRVDMMKALIMGASNTPYAHGCYEFDIFCDNKYPNESPKMNLMTTGGAKVRFNPNLYQCGKVCLSLLGTWRGTATENWDPKLSTILQVLVSTQAIIMSEDIYFNEPGFENEAGTVEGEKRNEAYANIVRYCNIKFAMIGQLDNPSRGFDQVIKRHFYVKKFEIMKEVRQWLEQAQKNEASYQGLVNDHNEQWSLTFKASKTKYKEMLQEAITQLEDKLNKLDKPQDIQQKLRKSQDNVKQKKQISSINEGKADLESVDVGEGQQIDSQIRKEMNIDDDAVKDRWSRYIGAMGVEAVAKQAAASIFQTGAAALGAEIAKNLVLSGCKAFTLHDPSPATLRDLSGNFFIYQDDIVEGKQKSRGEITVARLQQLNLYVRCRLAAQEQIPSSIEKLEQEPWSLQNYDVIISTESDFKINFTLSQFCRKHKKKFIISDCFGVFSRVFNDFGEQFEVLDKNGEELQDCVIKNISNSEQGIVSLLENVKHKLEDGDEVIITGVEGMKNLQKENESVNDKVFKVKVLSPFSFSIGDTLHLGTYKNGGTVKQLRSKIVLSFKPYEQTLMISAEQAPLDSNLAIADFEKISHNSIIHTCFQGLEKFRAAKQNKIPQPWDLSDSIYFASLVIDILKENKSDQLEDAMKDGSKIQKIIYQFAFQCQGVFNPLCAFIGGFVAQEAIKAITQKFIPCNQVFYYDSIEVLPELKLDQYLGLENLKKDEASELFTKNYVKKLSFDKQDRYIGIRTVLGQDLMDNISHCRLFMVGAGAIGCELLKNFAMIGVAVGEADQAKGKPAGSLVLTDPDVIEVSNLNRQFLFREKHLRKPKSSTAAAQAIQMNPDLKSHIVARLDKVHEGTNHIFSNRFFESLSVVTNALDNLQARSYVDLRCVSAKIPLLESGTLGPKGHVQVILPHQTESYNSQKDPEDNNEIPHCTLKMFPEETLHCIEWARDLFGKIFTQAPKSAIKLIEDADTLFKDSKDGTIDIKMLISQQESATLKEALEVLKIQCHTFDQCIDQARQYFEKYFNHDIRQLLHVYPLEAKTKEGNLFWSLPKRAPQPAEFDQNNTFHQSLVASIACLLAKQFTIEIPSKQPRSIQFKQEIAQKAQLIKVDQFIPDESAANEIKADVDKQKKDEQQEEKEENQIEQIQDDSEQLTNNLEEMIKKLQKKEISKQIKSEEFEKDDDSNFHIDFMFAMGNCRALNYKLEPMEWIQVKLKAGRIVPAMATTTASIAGLQTLELVKLLKNSIREDHRNCFLNLAVPIMQAGEPFSCQSVTVTETIKTTLWDRWQLDAKDQTLQQVFDLFQNKYQGLEVRDLLWGNQPIYFNAIMNAPGKENERQQLLDQTLEEILQIDRKEILKGEIDSYVDLTVTCTRKDDKDKIICEGIPILRVNLI